MTLKTAKQLAASTEESLPLGEKLYWETSQVRLPSPLVGASGKGKDRIYSTRATGVVVVRPYKIPNDPRTPFQLSKRSYHGEGQRNWSRISEAERADWGAWAYRHLYSKAAYAPSRSTGGYRTYCKMQFYRQGMGHGLGGPAPGTGVPAGIVSIEQVAPPDEEAFAFRVRHGQEELAGMRLLVELTPEMPTLERTPREGELVWYTETDADAFVPLEPDGTTYVLYGARHRVATGRRFAVRLRMVTEEGVPGPELMADLIKRGPEAAVAPAASVAQASQPVLFNGMSPDEEGLCPWHGRPARDPGPRQAQRPLPRMSGDHASGGAHPNPTYARATGIGHLRQVCWSVPASGSGSPGGGSDRSPGQASLSERSPGFEHKNDCAAERYVNLCE